MSKSQNMLGVTAFALAIAAAFITRAGNKTKFIGAHVLTKTTFPLSCNPTTIVSGCMPGGLGNICRTSGPGIATVVTAGCIVQLKTLG